MHVIYSVVEQISICVSTYRFTWFFYVVVVRCFLIGAKLVYHQVFAAMDAGAWSSLVHISCALMLVFLRNRFPEMEWLLGMHI